MNVKGGNKPGRSFQAMLINSEADIIVIPEWNGYNLDTDLFKQNGYHVLIYYPKQYVHGLCVLRNSKGFQLLKSHLF